MFKLILYTPISIWLNHGGENMKRCSTQILANWSIHSTKSKSPDGVITSFPSVDTGHIPHHGSCLQISFLQSACLSISLVLDLLSHLWSFCFSLLSRLALHCRKLYNMAMLYSSAEHDCAVLNHVNRGGSR